MQTKHVQFSYFCINLPYLCRIARMRDRTFCFTSPFCCLSFLLQFCAFRLAFNFTRIIHFLPRLFIFLELFLILSILPLKTLLPDLALSSCCFFFSSSCPRPMCAIFFLSFLEYSGMFWPQRQLRNNFMKVGTPPPPNHPHPNSVAE